MPQFDPATFLPQLFWLTVTFGCLFVVVWRYALPRISEVMAARQQHIDTDLEKAANLRREAEAVLADYEKALAEARSRAAAAIKQAGDELAAESARRHEAFGQEMASTAQEAEDRITAAKEEALAQIATVANEVAAAVAAKLTGTRPPGEQVENAVKEAMRGQD